MGKPFVITTPGADAISPHRDDQGRFARPPNPTVEQMQEKAAQSGRDLTDVVAADRVPDHPVAKGQPLTTAETAPWPKSTQWNDASKKPFRV